MGTKRTIGDPSRITFRGHSDDTFGWCADNGMGDDDDDSATETQRTWQLTAPGRDLIRVHGQWIGDFSTWSIGLEHAEGANVEQWGAEWGHGERTPILRLTVPAGTVIELVEIDGRPVADED